MYKHLDNGEVEIDKDNIDIMQEVDDLEDLIIK